MNWMYIIVNANGERMWQFDCYKYLDIAESVCRSAREKYPDAGLHVVKI